MMDFRAERHARADRTETAARMELQESDTGKLIREIETLRARVSKLEIVEGKHRQAELELRKSQELYQLLAENVNDVIWTMDMNLNYTYVSPSVERMRGYTAQEALSQKIEDMFTAESCNTIRQSFGEELALVREGGKDSYKSRTLEVQLKCEDGSVRWVEVKAAFLPDKEGQPIGVLGITRDIDKRKKAEEERTALLRRQQALLENIPAYVFLKDSEMRYTAVNRAYFDLLPRNVGDPIGKRDRDFFSVAVAGRFEKEDREVLEKGKTFTKEEAMRLRDGRLIDVAVSLNPVHAKTGEITGMVGIAFDITERKQAEEKLRHYADELEKANRELERLVAEVRELSLTDELTNLYNRRGFLTLAQQQLRIANRTSRGLSLFYFDLDNMKRINDELGHKAGDKALKETARMLGRTFRDSDIIARIGGDEFVVMAIESPEGGMDGFTSRLWKNLERRNRRANVSYPLSVSMGIAHYDPANPCLIEDLLSRADRLMYKNKKAKRKS
jgi:diguanylate cyclase (GGDEF)-like protein/PAS domain S-box-containing protein